LGVESHCELLDFELLDGPPLADLPEVLTVCLPEGVRVLAAYEATRKCKEIAWLRLVGSFEYDALADTAEVAERLQAFFGRQAVLVRKQTKKKEETEVDLIPLLREISFVAEGAHRVRMEAVVAAQNPSLSPNLLLEALAQSEPELSPDFVQFSRVEVYDEEMGVFW